MPKAEYAARLQEFLNLQKFGIKFGLSSTTALLDRLGHPEQGQLFVHIAGTNGKGSVAAFLAAILQAAGLKVGLYTSPHLVRFTERFQINGQEMSQEEAAQLMARMQDAFDPQEPPTFFEAVTAMALVYFAGHEADITILETGMGGRLDATNVVRPELSIITSISLEHQEYLGHSLLQIATEKAGIIKPQVPVLSGVSQNTAAKVIEDTCLEKNAPLYRLGRDMHYRLHNQRLFYYGQTATLRQLRISLPGRHQGRNAALALAASEILAERGWSIPHAARETGLAQAFWPGRMHLVSTHPQIMVDGAHNPAAIKALAKSLQERSYARLILVLGIMADKEAQPILQNILPLADKVIFTRPVYERAMDPSHLMAQAQDRPANSQIIRSLPQALDQARKSAEAEDLILVTGSLFTVGEALTHLDPEHWAPDPV